ncbi:MAG: hypothetical protein K6V97_11175 [Actinomycetia bacterium]|nr:hypothetical protein [Actinomycetes bacterium]
MSIIRWRDDPAAAGTPAEPPRRVVVCLPAPHAERLAQAIRDALGMEAVAQTGFAPVAGADAYLVLPDAADAARAVVPADRVGVLTGGPVRPEVARRLQGCALLPGALPGAALDWLAGLGAAPAPALVWAEPAPAAPDAARRAPAPAAAVSAPGASAPAAPAPAAPQAVAVYAAGGGVGKTTTAVCFAALAAEQTPTGLVELDENQGGILTYFDRRPQRGLDSLGPADWQDPTRCAAALEQVAVAVGPRLAVLPMLGTAGGLQCAPAGAAEADGLAPLFAWAAQRWAVTVYDLPADLRLPVVLATLRAATRIVWVVEPHEISVDNALAQLRLLEGLQATGAALLAKTALVVNKVPRPRRVGLAPERVAEALALPLLGAIPADPERYLAAINQHRLPADPAWRAAFAALALPGWDGAGPAPPPARRRWFPWRPRR